MEIESKQVRKPRSETGREMIKPKITNQQLIDFINHAMKVAEADLEFVQRGKIHGAQ